jgi:hypothetical protein
MPTNLTAQSTTARLETVKDKLNNEIQAFSQGSHLEEALESLGNTFGSRAFLNALIAAMNIDSDSEDHNATLAVAGGTAAIAVLKTAISFWRRKTHYERLVQSVQMIEQVEVLIEFSELNDANVLLLELEKDRVSQGIVPKRQWF